MNIREIVFGSRANFAAQDVGHAHHEVRERGIADARKVAAERLAAGQRALEEQATSLQNAHDAAVGEALAAAAAAKNARRAGLLTKLETVHALIARFPLEQRQVAAEIKAPLLDLVESTERELGDNFNDAALVASFCRAAGREEIPGAIDFGRAGLGSGAALDHAGRVLKAVRTDAHAAEIQQCLLALEVAAHGEIRALDNSGNEERGRVYLSHVGRAEVRLALGEFDRTHPWTPAPMTDADHKAMARSGKVM